MDEKTFKNQFRHILENQQVLLKYNPNFWKDFMSENQQYLPFMIQSAPNLIVHTTPTDELLKIVFSHTNFLNINEKFFFSNLTLNHNMQIFLLKEILSQKKFVEFIRKFGFLIDESNIEIQEIIINDNIYNYRLLKKEKQSQKSIDLLINKIKELLENPKNNDYFSLSNHIIYPLLHLKSSNNNSFLNSSQLLELLYIAILLGDKYLLEKIKKHPNYKDDANLILEVINE